MTFIEKIYKSIYNKDRLFILPGKKITDCLLSYYIDRKGIYDFLDKNNAVICGKVLDFGCGEKPYQKVFKFDSYIGVDVQSSGHADLRHEFVDYYYEKELPFRNEEFDSIISTQVFEHVAEIDFVLSELNRVLKKGGCMMATFPLMWPEHEIPYDFYRYTTYGIEKKLKDNGFECICCEKLHTSKNTMRQLRIINAIDKYLLSGCRPLQCILSGGVLVTNNLAFMFSNKDAKDTTMSLEIGIIGRKISSDIVGIVE